MGYVNNLAAKLQGDIADGASPEPECDLWHDVGVVIQYPSGAVLFSEAQQINSFAVFVQGAAKITITTAHGKSVVLRMCAPGDVVGLADVLAGGASSVRCTVLFDSVVRLVPTRILEQKMKDDPAVTVAVAIELARELTFERSRVRGLVNPSAASRLADFLGSIASQRGSGRGQVIPFPYTQEQLAELLGCSRETVGRLLAQFAAFGAVQRRGSQLLIQYDFEARIGRFVTPP